MAGNASESLLRGPERSRSSPPTHLHSGQAGAALRDLLGIAVCGLLDLEQPGCLREGLQRLLG